MSCKWGMGAKFTRYQNLNQDFFVFQSLSEPDTLMFTTESHFITCNVCIQMYILYTVQYMYNSINKKIIIMDEATIIDMSRCLIEVGLNVSFFTSTNL